MADLRLPKLPDRTAVKLTINMSPDLHHALTVYAALYRESYGVEEAVGDLIPPMLMQFLAGDRAFVKAHGALSGRGR